MNNDKVIIIGTGPSLKMVDKFYLESELREFDGRVISVNGAIDFIPPILFTDFFTLDCSDINRYRMGTGYQFIDYHFAGDQGVNYRLPHYVKKYNRISKRWAPLLAGRSKPDEYWLRRLGCMPKLSEDKDSIHTGNSMYGALGLAYHWRPKKILFLGLDGNTQPKVTGEGPCKTSLQHLPLLFSTALDQLKRENIEVMNGSIQSMVKCFQRENVYKGLEWIQT